MQEIWKTVITEDGIYENYQVSNFGRVKSLNYRHTGKEKMLSLIKNNKNYLSVKLCRNNTMKSYQVHRLVAMAFIPNVMNYKCIDHRDTNTQNNNILNLCWCTHEQNMNNELSKKKMSESQKGNTKMLGKHHTEEAKRKIGEARKGKCFSDETKKKISESKYKKVICLETREIFTSGGEASRQLGVNNTDISSVCNKKRKQAGKLTFRFLDQVLFYN